MSWLTDIDLSLFLSDPATRLMIQLILVFGSVFLVSLAAAKLMLSRNEVKRRASSPSRASSHGVGLPHQEESKRASEMLSRVGKLFAPENAESYSQSRKEMVQAGYFAPSAVPIYHAVRLIVALGFPAFVLFALSILPLGISGNEALIVMSLAAGLGFVGPSFFLRHRTKQMHQQFQSGFPDFMDLLVVCVEAGLSLQPAIARISRELAPTFPELAANLHLVGLEMRAGSTLTDALDGLSQRLNIEESASLASLLKQSEELGTSLSAALRVYSDEMRDKRLMRAEAKAHALPVKITLPVGFCIFPVILVVLFLPLLLRIKQLLAL